MLKGRVVRVERLYRESGVDKCYVENGKDLKCPIRRGYSLIPKHDLMRI